MFNNKKILKVKGKGKERKDLTKKIKSLFGVKKVQDVTLEGAVNVALELSDKVDALVVELFKVNPTNIIFKKMMLTSPEMYNSLITIARAHGFTYRPNYQSDVGDFHFKFGLDCTQKPTAPSPEVADFRLRCLKEECRELELALVPELRIDGNGKMDLAGALDALVDLMYFTLGTVRVLGLNQVFGEAWRRVHEANMKKVRAERPTDSKRGSTFDVVKPEGWVAPKLDDLVNGSK